MPREIVIDPVTRIEGHSKITLTLDDSGQVTDAMFHVTQFRGFEKFAEGRPLTEMPALMARTCGICPVSHLLAASKACDALLAVEIPIAAQLLRRVLNLAQILQSHALSFFHLSSPDFLFGMDGDIKKRNIFGLAADFPQMARDGIRLRQIGQTIIELLAGKRIHPAWTVAGGVNEAMTADTRDKIKAMLPDGFDLIKRALKWYKVEMGKFDEEAAAFGNFPTLFMGLVGPGGQFEYYDGNLRFSNAQGEIVADQLPNDKYLDYIGEAVEPFSYMKFPYFKSQGYPAGIYRVGPLARLNLCDRMGTPQADQEWAEFRQLQRGAVLSSFHYHYARLIEILFCCEEIQRLISNPEILSDYVRARARPNRFEGVGISEAPRGTLIHHYKIDRNGLVTWANLVIATGHNNLAMNRAVKAVAQKYVKGNKIQEGMLNRVEAAIRCYDPCLSCSTHAIGQMPLQVEVLEADGTLLQTLQRER
jgi:NAD-reducing hydrogenase large subunit